VLPKFLQEFSARSNEKLTTGKKSGNITNILKKDCRTLKVEKASQEPEWVKVSE
jgi:hypothetical protein